MTWELPVSIWSDLRLTLRHLRRSPGFTITAVLTLALAVAANSAIFSAVRSVLLRPLPVASPGELSVTWQTDAGGRAVIELTHRHLREWMQNGGPFRHASLMASHNWSGVMTGRGEPARLWFAGVSGTFFDTMGVAPAHGRALRGEDDVPNGPGVAVLNHASWQRRFGGDPSVVGSTITIDGGPLTIVGVMPEGFDIPSGAEFWVPIVPILASGTPPNTANLDRVGLFYVVGRAAGGLDAAAVRSSLQALEARLDAADPARLKWGPRVVTVPLLTHLFGPMRPALWTLWAAVGVLLLIACANVSGLMLTRVAAQRRESSVRLALGASRLSVARLRLLEIAVVSGIGGLIGLAGAVGTARAIVALAPDDLPRIGDTAIDPVVALFTFGLVLLASLLAAAVPMRQAGRANLVESLDGSRTTVDRRSLRARSALVVVQIGLAVVLLVAAGLVVRSFASLRQVDVGFVPDRILTATVQPRGVPGPPNEWMHAFLGRIRSLPGVEDAGAVYLRPLMLGPIGQGVRVILEGQPDTRESAEANPTLNHQIATSGYFETMRVPLVRGRFFTDQDTAGTDRVVIVSETTAARLWPGQDPIGRRVSMATFSGPGSPARAWRTVVGVVADVRYRGLGEVQLDIYDPARQVGRVADNVVVRASGDPAALAGPIRALARELAPDAVIEDVTTMDAVVGRAEAPWRLTAWMFGLFAAVAFAMSALGLWSLVALDVAFRRREFAVRLALGSSHGAIVGGVLRRAGRRVVLGMAAGLGGAVALTRFMQSLLFGVEPYDVATYGGVLLLVTVVVAAAAWLPARRAARTEPQALMRES
jgi:predicted permease